MGHQRFWWLWSYCRRVLWFTSIFHNQFNVGVGLDASNVSNSIEIRANYLTLVLLRCDSGPILHTTQSISLLTRHGSRMAYGNVHGTMSTIKLWRFNGVTNESHQYYCASEIIPEVFGRRCIIDFVRNSNVRNKQWRSSGVRKAYANVRKIYDNSNRSLTDEPCIKARSDLFYQPYGRIFVCMEGQRSYGRFHEILSSSKLSIKGIRTLKKRRLRFCLKDINIRRKLGVIHRKLLIVRPESSVEIATRCTIESPANAIAPFTHKIRADYRNMFGRSDYGDVSIVVEGENVAYPHRYAEQPLCPYFAAMFSRRMAWTSYTLCSRTRFSL